MFKIYDEPDSPNEGAYFGYMMNWNRQRRGAGLRYMMYRNRQVACLLLPLPVMLERVHDSYRVWGLRC